MARIALEPRELAYLIRSVERDLEEFEAECWVGEPDPAEAALGDIVLRTLRQAEQEQVFPH